MKVVTRHKCMEHVKFIKGSIIHYPSFPSLKFNNDLDMNLPQFITVTMTLKAHVATGVPLCADVHVLGVGNLYGDSASLIIIMEVPSSSVTFYDCGAVSLVYCFMLLIQVSDSCSGLLTPL